MSLSKLEHCHYILENGNCCQENEELEGLCFWHNPTIDKTGPEIKEAIEKQVQEGKSLEGYVLSHANLANINLVKAGSTDKTNMTYADLSHANLRSAHLYRVNLQGVDLKKADLTRANLNRANLRQANLLGIHLLEARIEHTEWGDTLIQEECAFEARKVNNKEKAHDFYEQSEEIYRELKQEHELRGQFENAGWYFYKEMVMRRYQFPLFSKKRLFSKIIDLLCGYGEKYIRVILFALSSIFGCAILYWIFGVEGKSGVIAFQTHTGIKTNLMYLWDCIYFSIITFTTLGYGDIVPFGFSRVIAAFEALLGAFTIALFLVVFVKGMTR